MESRVDTDGDGLPDLVKVSDYPSSLPRANPRRHDRFSLSSESNDPASDKALHNMNVDLAKKEPHQITVQDPQAQIAQLDSPAPAQEVSG